MDNLEDYYDGKGCKCCARSEGECSCGVDWTPKEVYLLREQLKTAKIDAVNEFANKVCGDCSTEFKVDLSFKADWYCKGLANE